MAEYAAHVAAPCTDGPSVFEVLAQENLHDVLQPSLRHLIKFLAKKFPKRFRRLDENFDVAFTACHFFIQHHCLKKYGGSVAEHFYGLRRTSDSNSQTHLSGYVLPLGLHVKSLLVLCFASEIKRRIDRLFEELRDLDADGLLRGQRATVVRAFLYVYPFLHAFWQATDLYYQIAYVFGKTKCHSPLLRLVGGRLIRFTQEDADLAAKNLPVLSEMTCMSDVLKATPKIVYEGATKFVAYALNIGAFFIQYLDWWQANDQPSLLPQVKIPPPPKIENAFTAAIAKLGNKCPLCLGKRTNETVVATSGYVFCYKCIQPYVKKTGHCPVTKYVTSEAELIRLLPNS